MASCSCDGPPHQYDPKWCGGRMRERTIPFTEPDPRESGRRNRAALRYLHKCGTMRVEPDKHKLERILLGREDETGEEL